MLFLIKIAIVFSFFHNDENKRDTFITSEKKLHSDELTYTFSNNKLRQVYRNAFNQVVNYLRINQCHCLKKKYIADIAVFKDENMKK